MFKHSLFFFWLMGLSLLSSCMNKQVQGDLLIRRDDVRGRTATIDTQNQIHGTFQNTPAWLNPGIYIYDRGKKVYFIQVKTRSTNIPFGLYGVTFYMNNQAIPLKQCSQVQMEKEEESGTPIFFESMECKVHEEFFTKIGKAPNVRLKLHGKKEDRPASLSAKNQEHFLHFLEEVTKSTAE